MIQVDVDDSRLGRNRPVDVAVLADAKAFLVSLLERLKGARSGMPLAERRRAVAELAQDKQANRGLLDAMLAKQGAPMLTAHAPAICRRVFDDDAIVVFDGGNTAIWGNFFSEIRVPNTQLATAHFGHLGAGVGQALGAAVARPGKQVYCLIGDGAMGFNMQEIETAVRHGLPVIFLVCCDRQWGMVKINQFVQLIAVCYDASARTGRASTPTSARSPGMRPSRWAHGERVGPAGWAGAAAPARALLGDPRRRRSAAPAGTTQYFRTCTGPAGVRRRAPPRSPPAAGSGKDRDEDRSPSTAACS
jgi:hypothetical protein